MLELSRKKNKLKHVEVLQNYTCILLNGFSLLLGPQKSSHIGICQQAGCERLDVCSRDISASQSHFHQGPPLAHTRLLRSDRRGVSHKNC